MSKSSKRSRSRNRRPVSEEARPFPHGSGYWAKKCRGKLIYLKRIADDPDGEAAWAEWLRIGEDLRAGIDPSKPTAGVTLGRLVNDFLNAKRQLVESGERSERTLTELVRAGRTLVKVLGKTRPVADIGPDDFAKVRRAITKRNGSVRTANEISRIKSVFRWGHENGKIDHLPRYGDFKKPSTKTTRLERAAKGERLFTSDEVLSLLELANVNQRAFLLLGLNTGMGQSDIATLPKHAIKGEWLDYVRGKTGVQRRAWLWPETREAVAAAMQASGPAENPEDDGLAFRTSYGGRWIVMYKGTPDDRLSEQFRTLMKRAKLDGRGLSFYRLRHLHRTLTDECLDWPAANAVMGHADQTMAGVYRERVSDERIRRVCEHVRCWLFGAATDTGREQTPADLLAVAIGRARAAIEAAEGPTRRTLESVWLPELQNAAEHPRGSAAERLLDVWGQRPEAGEKRPMLRVVGE